jgi:hypothetical protein
MQAELPDRNDRDATSASASDLSDKSGLSILQAEGEKSRGRDRPAALSKIWFAKSCAWPLGSTDDHNSKLFPCDIPMWKVIMNVRDLQPATTAVLLRPVECCIS